jgi:hypothetical protein
MDFTKALALRVEYSGVEGSVRCFDDYVCLNDLAAYYPNKRLDNWLANNETKALIQAVEAEFIIPGKGGIITKRGKGGGTYAHHLIALDFAAWLSAEYRLRVYKAYVEGTQHKKDWTLSRELAARNYKLLCQAVKGAHIEPKAYHYSNEALMINEIVFGVREGKVRDTASEAKLDEVAQAEQHNATMIMLGMGYEDRKNNLKGLMYKRIE